MKRAALFVGVAVVLAACAAGTATAVDLKTGQFAVLGTPTGAAESHEAKDDPIVAPGQPGASHLHVFAGNRSTDAFSTLASLDAASSALTETRNHSAYWSPAVYYNGVKQTLKVFKVYYRAGRSKVPLTPQPRGLKIIAGNAHATSPQSAAILTWQCGVGGAPTRTSPPPSCDGAPMQIDIKFPECWDGSRLDSADHKSHMAASIGTATTGRECPASHPVMLGQVQQVWTYPDPAGRTVSLSSGSWMTFHADAFFAWDAAVLQQRFDQCLNANTDCGVVSG